MQALRQIQTAEFDNLLIKIPRAFQKRRLEVIVIPVDETVKTGAVAVSLPAKKPLWESELAKFFGQVSSSDDFMNRKAYEKALER